MTSVFFQNLARWNIEHNGTTVALPYPYYDYLSLGGVFTASTPEVRKLIPQPDLFPIELRPGRCLAGIGAFEYHQTEGEPYNEIGVSFLVSYKRRTLTPFGLVGVFLSMEIPCYIWQLPVTTETARAGGFDLWGFPKFIADIQFTKGEQWIECTLSLSAVKILSIRGRVLPTGPGKPFRYVNYSLLQDALLASSSHFNPLEFCQSINQPDMELIIGDGHPICQTLRDLQLAKNPLVYQFIPKGEAILFPPRNVREI